ncbi:uncharacterized protein LOC126567171 [Anopheles maculipalpis]|uniref:uncharacterized protein LOC126567171 n=1 Tax=Anopheles maculipalpis TaxID=1496333 RepID=UPI002159980E|nr:uncharacterized protein LOC126567171 [Anopheles maculipalpis]
MKLLLVLFAVVLLSSCLEAIRCFPKRCPRNEVFSCCADCPQKYCVQQDINCPAVCRPGCVCRTGFVRSNEFGNCISPKLCSSGVKGMNWMIVLLFAAAAGCGMCAAQSSTTVRTPGTTSTPKGLIPLPPRAKCPISTCGRNEVLKACGLCYDNTCSGKTVQACKAICYCGCYSYSRLTHSVALIVRYAFMLLLMDARQYVDDPDLPRYGSFAVAGQSLIRSVEHLAECRIAENG